MSDDTLCSLTGSQPPVTQKDILSTTSTDKVLTMLMNKIEKGFPETKTELELEIQPYWRVRAGCYFLEDFLREQVGFSIFPVR